MFGGLLLAVAFSASLAAQPPASWHWASAVAIYPNFQGIPASVAGQPMNTLDVLTLRR